MAILKIVKDGDPLLRKTSRPVETVTPRILTLLDDMLETMRKADGVGLAAVQVGVLRRVVVIETEPGNPRFFINPAITGKEGAETALEGCLSVPERWGKVERPSQITITYLDRDGKSVTSTETGLTARCLCHECDHLDGVLFTDLATEFFTRDEIEEVKSDEKSGKHRKKEKGK